MADWSSDEEDGGSGAPEDAGAGEHTERFYNEKYNDLVSPARCSDSFGDVGRARPPALRPMLVALASQRWSIRGFRALKDESPRPCADV